ncbi:MAG: hypothetical protein AAF513_12530 [Pseudomonadota bacterium]
MAWACLLLYSSFTSGTCFAQAASDDPPAVDQQTPTQTEQGPGMAASAAPAAAPLTTQTARSRALEAVEGLMQPNLQTPRLADQLDLQLPTVGDIDYNYIESQIYSGEEEPAARNLETLIEQIETAQNRYHPDLIVPLALLGDAKRKNDDFDEALDHYSRARHVARVHYGLFDMRQIPLVYREADTHRLLGELKEAGKSEEYAYEVIRKAHDPLNPAVIPALHRLAGFYVQSYNLLAARSLYNQAINIHEVNGSDLSTDAIPAYEGIALTHRLERFPPFYVKNPDDNPFPTEAPPPGLSGNELRKQYVAFNNFPAGERALQRIVKVRQEGTEGYDAATTAAILQLADWHLLFGRTHDAGTLYSHVFTEMQTAGEDAIGFFAEPKLVYFPRPFDPSPPRGASPEDAQTGEVTLEFIVSATGRVRGLKTRASYPPRLMDFRVRRSMRAAVFRPRLIDGVSTRADAQSYTHEFSFFADMTVNGRPMDANERDRVQRVLERDAQERGADATPTEGEADEAPLSDASSGAR